MNTNRGSCQHTIALVLVLAGPGQPSLGAEPADAIYTGGPIVTMNDAQPSAEAVAVRAGRILALGTRAAIESAHRAGATELVDLAGSTLIPGIIDPHSHFMNALVLQGMVNVAAPPVGRAQDPAAIVGELRRAAAARAPAPGAMLIGHGYDPALMPQGQALDRAVLDEAFPSEPVVVLHVSLHGAVLNGAAMQRFGITAATPTPPGGVIVRRPGSNEPAGLVMETAFLPIAAQMPLTTPEQQLLRLEYAQQLYAAAGVTTAQDGATMATQLELLERAAERDALYLDIVAYPFNGEIDKVLARRPAADFGHYRKHLKLGGCKLVTDGSPQAKTAFFTTPYAGGGPNGEHDWRGEPLLSQQHLDAMLKRCYDAGLQTLVHANGDAAIDMLLAAHEHAAAGSLAADRRTTAIHAQFARPDQLERFARYRIIPSFFSEHAFFFSAAHLRNRGREQTFALSPLRSAIARGLRPTNHTDFSVVPIDHMLLLWSAVTREARDGSVIGPAERLDPWQALQTITINAAWQYREETSKGSIEPAKLADLVVLNANPLDVAPAAIREIRVLRTIKEGRTIYPR